MLPVFTYKQHIGACYADSTYSVTIEYPEFVTMSDADVRRYHAITDASLPEMPEIMQATSVDRKQGELTVSFVPLVFRDGQYQKLVSFMLEVKGEKRPSLRRAPDAAESYYAAHSVLASGRWAKISVPSTGIYQLTSELIRKAGFSDINKVKVYGYGGGLQPEKLMADYLAATDDLQEVPTCEVGGKRLFYAVGPVTWNDNHQRIRNPYSNVGCYFLTENDSVAKTMSEEEFLSVYYPLADDYNTLYEVDNYAWYHGGRNLYDATVIAAGGSHTYTVPAKGTGQKGLMTVVVTGDAATRVTVSMNDEAVGVLNIANHGSYEQMNIAFEN